jgi:isocitrate/isopropylmalate dehydrogenase
MAAIELVTSRGETMPPDLGGQAGTREVTAAVIRALDEVNV